MIDELQNFVKSRSILHEGSKLWPKNKNVKEEALCSPLDIQCV
jgi:hypothetical protein